MLREVFDTVGPDDLLGRAEHEVSALQRGLTDQQMKPATAGLGGNLEPVVSACRL